MKKNLGKKNTFARTMTKVIPLSVAMSLFFSTSALAGVSGELVVEIGTTKYTFDAKQLREDGAYRSASQALLRKAWKQKDAIYYSDNGVDYVEVGKQSNPNALFEQLLEDANRVEIPDEEIYIIPDVPHFPTVPGPY